MRKTAAQKAAKQKTVRFVRRNGKNTKGGNVMDKSFVCGMILGLLGGAIIVTNSYKARKLVKDGQEEIKNKVSEMTEKKSGKKEDDYDELNG